MMFKYEIILYWSNVDGAFVAEVPELAKRLLGAWRHTGRCSEEHQSSDGTLDRHGEGVRRPHTGAQGRASDACVRAGKKP